jgi:transcription-repair coupling factor (superfamily II helicase)
VSTLPATPAERAITTLQPAFPADPSLRPRIDQLKAGLDIASANTLIVQRADTLGLAQLYQIRGRVGRSDVVAHAYLFYPDARELTPEARARLATLADHTELGAGFAIAMRDLEIRGAGNLLGSEQSGHVAAIGFELYLELLGEAVAELSGARRALARPVRVDAQVDAYVPTDYIAVEAAKIDLHRRIALAEDEDELRELRASVEDRFGPVPAPVAHLFGIQEVKLKLARVGADYLVLRNGRAAEVELFGQGAGVAWTFDQQMENLAANRVGDGSKCVHAESMSDISDMSTISDVSAKCAIQASSRRLEP